MSTSPNLALSYLVASQAQKEVTHNDALNDVDVLVQLSVVTRTLSAAPASPAEGDTYIVAASPTGIWSGHAGHVASYYAGWRFKTPKEGWLAYLRDEDVLVAYDGSAWNAFKIALPLGSASTPSCSFVGDGNTGLFSPSADVVALATGGTERVRVNGTEFRPGSDNALTLGTASQRWQTVYAVTGTINTSDARAKEKIAPVDGDFARAFVKALPAKTYAWLHDPATTHYGFIAQDVAQILLQMHKNATDFGGLAHEKAHDVYGLRYDAFIPLLWNVVQQQLARVEVLEEKGIHS